ncbi:MAG: DUF892 family protein [Bacteroidota bacterium]
MDINTLKDLYIEQLRDLHSAESQVEAVAPAIIDAATNETLKTAIRHHHQAAQQRQQQIKAIVEKHGAKATGHKCKGMEGLIKEAKDMVGEHDDAPGAVLDAGIITHAQRMLHYELAGFGTVNTYAQELGDDASFFQEVLDQTYDADRTLTDLAANTINPKAEA